MIWRSKNVSIWAYTLQYLINVGVRLLNFQQISSHYALIPYPTFINFKDKFHLLPLFFNFPDGNLQIHYINGIFSTLCMQICWFFHKFERLLSHLNIFYTFEGNIPSPTSIIFWQFPPNTFIPYPTFIILRWNVHPIWLFHTLPLLGTQEYIG